MLRNGLQVAHFVALLSALALGERACAAEIRGSIVGVHDGDYLLEMHESPERFGSSEP
jgi:hypothetical protein